MEQADCPYRYRFDNWKIWPKPAFTFSQIKQCKRKIVSEIQQTEIEKLADSFKLAGFTLADSFEIPRNL